MAKKRKPRVCYYLKKPAHVRCVQTIPECKDIEQIVIGPYFDRDEGLVNHYSDINIKSVITVKDECTRDNIIKDIRPDILVLDHFVDVKKSFSFINKTICLFHGERHPIKKSLFTKINKNKKQYKYFDAYLVGSKFSKEFLIDNIGISEDRIFTDTMPQLDIALKNHIIGSDLAECGNKKSILFMGHIGLNRRDFPDGNIIDFFNILFSLSDATSRLGFKLFVKPRVPIHGIEKILMARKDIFSETFDSIKDKLEEVYNNENVVFIDACGHVYKYYSSDVVIGHGTSTVEVECICAKIPYIKVMISDKTDGFAVSKNNALITVDDMPSLIGKLQEIIIHGKNCSKEHEERLSNYLNNVELLADGSAGKRALNAIRGLI